MKTILHPTAGYIANCGQDVLTGYVADMAGESKAGMLDASQKNLLRELAKKVSEIASLPIQKTKKRLWRQKCKLGKLRPLLLVFPEDSWNEIIPPQTMTIKDAFWGQVEWYLKHLIYRHENIRDDFVIEPHLYVTRSIKRTSWGLEAKYTRKDEKGSYIWDPPIQEESDLYKLKFPHIEVDDKDADDAIAKAKDVLGDILDVRDFCFLPGMLTYDIAAGLRGIEELMMDMYDRPKWLHQLMDFISQGIVNEADYLEKNGYLRLNNDGHYVDTGGIAYTNELAKTDFSGNVQISDLWGYGAAQAATGVGPDMHEEFILQYDKRLLDKCGLVSYGCCEPYTVKFGMLKKNLKNLRRVSVSPWCDIDRAAEELGDEYIFSCKPNPALIADFDPEIVRKDIRSKLDASKGCVVEVILKDTFTIKNDPPRVTKWTDIVMEEIQRIS